MRTSWNRAEVVAAHWSDGVNATELLALNVVNVSKGIVLCLATMTGGREGLGCFGDAWQDGPGWVPAAVCSAPWGISGCSVSRGDGRLRLCGADGARVPFPVSPAGGAGPRVRVG